MTVEEEAKAILSKIKNACDQMSYDYGYQHHTAEIKRLAGELVKLVAKARDMNKNDDGEVWEVIDVGKV